MCCCKHNDTNVGCAHEPRSVTVMSPDLRCDVMTLWINRTVHSYFCYFLYTLGSKEPQDYQQKLKRKARVWC